MEICAPNRLGIFMWKMQMLIKGDSKLELCAQCVSNAWLWVYVCVWVWHLMNAFNVGLAKNMS